MTAASARRLRLADCRRLSGDLRKVRREAVSAAVARPTFTAAATVPRALTPIMDTEGNIFEGVTPVRWELPTPIGMGREPIPVDPRRKSLLFTLKNPRNFPMRKLIKAGEKN
jgi:hypothetical protein